MMDGKTDRLSMTRHERRGALALLVLVLAAIVALWFMRTRPAPVNPTEVERMRQFERTIDSIHQRADSVKVRPAKSKSPVSRGKRKKTSTKPVATPKPASQHLAPVPQI